MQTELQNAFELSQIERAARGVDGRIGEALARGFFVVYCYITAHCPRTDAVMGEDRAFEAALATEAEALALVEDLDARGWDVGVLDPPVYGCAPAPAPEVEIPF